MPQSTDHAAGTSCPRHHPHAMQAKVHLFQEQSISLLALLVRAASFPLPMLKFPALFMPVSFKSLFRFEFCPTSSARSFQVCSWEARSNKGTDFSYADAVLRYRILIRARSIDRDLEFTEFDSPFYGVAFLGHTLSAVFLPNLRSLPAMFITWRALAAVALAVTNTALIGNVHRRGGKLIWSTATSAAQVLSLIHI